MKTVILDAMIAREDIYIETNYNFGQRIDSLSINDLLPERGLLLTMLRKPDFQRETNQWTPEQVVSFLESFLDGLFIPSVIFWRGSSYVFVIDGGHRLSVLRAWINDDYGDGIISLPYFSNNISTAQRKIAEKTRNLVNQKIGKYEHLKSLLNNPPIDSVNQLRRSKNLVLRSITLQWVEGDQDTAESSFFKINTKGTALDGTEEMLLKNRKRSVAIAARSIVRAGTGHSYWSKFDNKNKQLIEKIAKHLHSVLFKPEIDTQIRTMDLPLAGNKSPIDALKIIINLICVILAPMESTKSKIDAFPIDETGDDTIATLEKISKIFDLISGNSHGILGLHPAVYYYSDNGQHMPDLFIGVILLFNRKLNDNDRGFLKKFTSVRSKIEDLIISKKSLILQTLQLERSTQRAECFANFIIKIVNKIEGSESIDDSELVQLITKKASGNIIGSQNLNSSGKKFSSEAKNGIYIRQALKTNMKCPICNGYILPTKSHSYDHNLRIREGGDSSIENGQLVHPFCNTGYKN